MDAPQREKRLIQRREQIGPAGCSLLALAAFLVPAIIASSVRNAFWLFFLSFPILGILGLVTLGPFMQRTQQQKQNWLNEYGRRILAPIARYPKENAFIIREQVRISRRARRRRRNSSYYWYVNWQDPDTGRTYAFPVNTRFYSALRNIPEGSLHPVQFDPADPSFFAIPTER